SQAIVLPPAKLVLAELTEVTPSRQMTFDEVQAQLHDEVVQGRVTGALQKHAQALYDRARDMNNDLEKAAKSMGLEVKTSEEFTRSGTVKDLDNTSANYFQQGFRLPDGSVYGPIPLVSSTVVVKVIAHVAADMSELPAQRSKIRDDIKSKKAEERNNLF